ncbi:hypothetical protein HDU81_001560, partial [Chytriomyces hyalinus]
GITAKTWAAMLGHIRVLLAAAYNSFEYLMKSDALNDIEKTLFHRIQSNDESVGEAELQVSLKSKCAYPAPPEESDVRPGQFFVAARDFFGGLFSALLKGNDDNLFKAVLVGVLRVSKSDFLSGLNNIGVYTFTEPEFSDKFGFTEKEVDLLLQTHQSNTDPKEVKAGVVQRISNKKGVALYNPWSIMSMCENGELKNYWVETGNTRTIKALLASRGGTFRGLVDDLLGDKICGQDSHGISLAINDSLRYESLSSDASDDDVWTL